MAKEVPVITGDKRVDRKVNSLLDIIRRNYSGKGDHLTAMFLTHRIKEAVIRSKELDADYKQEVIATMDEALTEIAIQYALHLKANGDPLEEILGPLLSD